MLSAAVLSSVTVQVKVSPGLWPWPRLTWVPAQLQTTSVLTVAFLPKTSQAGGEEVEVEAKLVKLGKDIATVDVQLKSSRTGETVATGTHIKKLVSASDLSVLFEALDGHPKKQQAQQQQQQQQPRSRL